MKLVNQDIWPLNEMITQEDGFGMQYFWLNVLNWLDTTQAELMCNTSWMSESAQIHWILPLAKWSFFVKIHDLTWFQHFVRLQVCLDVDIPILESCAFVCSCYSKLTLTGYVPAAASCWVLGQAQTPWTWSPQTSFPSLWAPGHEPRSSLNCFLICNMAAVLSPMFSIPMFLLWEQRVHDECPFGIMRTIRLQGSV